MATSELKSVAVLGTGIMGAPMARNLARAGIATCAWNRTLQRAEPLADDGVAIARSPREAADGADAVITMLAAADAVREVMAEDGGALGALGPEAVWLQMSTIGLAATEEMGRLAADAGVTFVDAPVLGTKQPAEAGELVVLAAGPAAALDGCAPVFEAIGARTVRLREAGEASRLKLVLNNWVLALTAATAETIALAERLGVDPRSFLETIAGGNLDSGYAQTKGAMMIDRSFEPSFPLRLAAKDARLILEAAAGSGPEPELPRAVERRFARAEELGHGSEDMAAVLYASLEGD